MNLPEALRAYPEADIKALPRVWLDASLEALEASNWAGKPQARAIQAVCLHLALQGTTSGQDGASRFFVWLSAATRLCQLMGLHRLGSDPSIMPREDPAWPTQPCSLRRELGKRLWSFVLSFDWMNCSSAGFSQIQEGSCESLTLKRLSEVCLLTSS